MNILPLIFTFLIIFSCICLTLFREMKSYFLVETTLESYHRTERALTNAVIKKAYRKIPIAKAPSKTPAEQNTTKRAFTSRREFFPPLEASKFNLSPLIQHVGDLNQSPLYEPLAELLRLLYQKKIFDKEPKSEGIEYRLLEEILKKMRLSPGILELGKLFPDNPDLAKIYYKMLKGTNQYSRTKGIPPLGDFLSLEKTKSAVSVNFASSLLLEAFFGPEITQQILREEKKKRETSAKYYYFSKEDLKTLLMQHPTKGPLITTLDPFLDYSKQLKARTHIGGRDKRTGIGLQKSL